jgi:hypothetical protein
MNILKLKNFVLLFLSAIIYNCSSDNSIVNPPINSSYVKIYTFQNGVNKFEIYSKTNSSLVYGFNELGFKVFINNTEQTQGYVKFYPIMQHGIGGPSHSIPVPEKYFYSTDNSLFTGYAIFTMYDTTANWVANLNYNDQMSIDTVSIDIIFSNRTLIASWDHSGTQQTYFLTLIDMHNPRVGLNDMDVMLHKTTDMYTYYEVNNAEHFIRPWMESMGHGSSNNQNPVFIGNGRYKGKANFNMPGEWYLYDSIKVNGSFITNTPPPKFILQVN